MTDEKAIEYANALWGFCKSQKSCQSCVFRRCGPETFGCNIQAYDLREVTVNYEVKRKAERHVLEAL